MKYVKGDLYTLNITIGLLLAIALLLFPHVTQALGIKWTFIISYATCVITAIPLLTASDNDTEVSWIIPVSVIIS